MEMLLILEIILTITAWRRGWKAWALLPAAVTGVMGFLIGLAIGASGGNMNHAMPVCLMLDFVFIASLVAMIAKPRKAKQHVVTPAQPGPVAAESVGHDLRAAKV
jgi:hypothetical protein